MVLKADYLYLLSDRDHILMLDEMYHGAVQGKEEEVDMITHELVIN